MEWACSHFKEELKYAQGDCSAINIRQCVENLHGTPKLELFIWRYIRVPRLEIPNINKLQHFNMVKINSRPQTNYEKLSRLHS